MRAALEMHASLEKMNPQILERHGVRLSMRVGVNTGDVIAGAGGDQLMITGDVVNVAARLQQTAEPGQVVTGERTYLATRGALVFEPLQERTLKGKTTPVQARRLIEPGELVRPRGVPGLATRMVGRDRQLELLESLYTAAVVGTYLHHSSKVGVAEAIRLAQPGPGWGPYSAESRASRHAATQLVGETGGEQPALRGQDSRVVASPTKGPPRRG